MRKNIFVRLKEYFSTYPIKRKLYTFLTLLSLWLSLFVSGLIAPRPAPMQANQQQTLSQQFENRTGEITLTKQIFSESNGILRLDFTTKNQINGLDTGIDPQKLKWKIYAKNKEVLAKMEVIPIVDEKISVLVKNLPSNFEAIAIEVENKTVDVNQLDININDEETSDSTSKNKDANILQFMIYQKSKALKHKKLQDLTQQEFAIQQLDNELVFQNKQVHKLKNAISQLEKSIEEDEQTKEKLQSENQYLTSDERVKNLNDIDTLNANVQNKHLQIDQAKNNIDKVKEKIEVIQLKKEDVQNVVFDFQKPVEVEIKK